MKLSTPGARVRYKHDDCYRRVLAWQELGYVSPFQTPHDPTLQSVDPMWITNTNTIYVILLASKLVTPNYLHDASFFGFGHLLQVGHNLNRAI